ncbi:hypothetical protein [Acaryochloris marina]|uniref:hypothetical protein n=1 Tax=Acaryochloris marina TaxID=155978 RepID=UPI001BB04E0E|nr:hypothetical protein [Acaryochloris marina]QUY43114.1 hypothetical protein I1H34_02830 [Acaryochloris marina S15]
MSAKQWVSRNLSLGGLIRNTGNAAGTVANIGLHGLGVVAEATAKAAGNPHHQTIGKSLKVTGAVVNIALTKTGEGAGFVANKATEYAGAAGGSAAAFGAQVVGAQPDTVATAKKVGTVVGAATVGAVAGVGLAEAAVAMAAVSGTTGAAATSSGLAAIGGGSLASGGGGMAAGQAITQSIVATSTTAGVIGKDKEGTLGSDA